MEKRHPFNVRVDGVPEKYLSMNEIMRAFHSCKNSDPEMARTLVEYACNCGHIPAKLAYASFLRTSLKLNVSQKERYKKAEAMLLEIYNLLDIPDSFLAQVACELGMLYAECLHRPIGALAMFLQAKRLGAHVEERDISQLHRKMERTDINKLGANSDDALHLGRELMLSGGSAQLTELFLREAVDRSISDPTRKVFCGIACLALAEFYSAHRSESQTYRDEAARMYGIARKHGFPEYLSPERPHTLSGGQSKVI